MQPEFAASYAGSTATVTNVVWRNTTTNTSNCRRAGPGSHPKEAVGFCPNGFGPDSAPTLENGAGQWCKRPT